MAIKNIYTNKLAFSIVLASSLFLAHLAFAETRTEIMVRIFEEEYTYQASEYDSRGSCRVLALEQAKRLLLEKWGTYLESETEVRNFQLTKDQIITLTAGLVGAEIIDEKWDGKTYYLKAVMATNPKDVIISIENLRRDRQKTKELEETRKKADEALKEVERLRKELEIAKAERPNLSHYNEAVNRLSSIDCVEKGFGLGNAGGHQEAIGAFTKAIELNPKYAEAFYNRGEAYLILGNLRQAIRDYDKAIELDPKDAEIYVTRGGSYRKLGDHQQAIRDYDQAIQLYMKDATVYFLRGFAYYNLGNYWQAIKDYDRAIELDPQYAKAYGARGMAYLKLGNNHKAFEQLKIAARLGDKGAENFLKSEGISW